MRRFCAPHPLRYLLALGALILAIAVSSNAMAQVGLGGGGLPPPGGPPPGGPPGGAAPTGPPTHAASGAEGGATLPSQPAQLPEDPNELTPEMKELLKSDYDPNVDLGREAKTERDWYGPYYAERSGDYRLRTVFPFWLEREQKDDYAALYGLSYYHRRSKDHDADVFFPLFWKLRDKEQHTTVVANVVHRESPTGHDNWVAPLFFEGEDEEDDTSYLHIPPLLTFHHRTNRGGFSMAGPAFCTWKGGPACDSRSADEIDMGIAPFYFYGRDTKSEYELIPPLLHYYSYEERGEEELNVWGPLWMEKNRDGGVFNILPLFWRNWNETEDNITLAPLFHYGTDGPASTLITPLFYNHDGGPGGDQTFATYLYARHRGRTELDMITPLFWQYRDPDIELERTFLLPFFYRNVSPRSDDIAVFPFYGSFKRHGISNETWVTPLVRHRTDLTGWQLNVFPLFHMGQSHNNSHLVLAPLYWDFNSPNERSTVAFPFYWRFSDRKSLSQVVGNTYYSTEKVPGGTEWQFHFFPVFSVGATPQGHWWNVLYGLAGYTREGTMSKMRVGYIPFTLSE